MKTEELSVRRYDIDWLRNLGIFLLFPFHAARIFDYWDPFYVKGETLSWGLSWFIVLTSYWFMPLLFLLAGSASWYALKKRSSREYAADRVSRLLIPFLFGMLVLIPPQGYFASLHHQGEGGSYFSFWKSFFTDFSDLSGYFGTFTPAHLWFILYLFILSLAALPFFNFYRTIAATEKGKRLHQACSRPSIYLSFFLVLAVMELFPAPGGQNPFFFLAIFIAGFVICSNPAYQVMINHIRSKALIGMAFSVPVWIVLLQVSGEVSTTVWFGAAMALLRALNVWLTLTVFLGYGNKYLNRNHKWLPYLNEAAFPIYIVHQTVLVAAGYFILKSNLSVPVSFLLIMLLTFAVSVCMYEFVIKQTAVTRWLFGVKGKTAGSSPKSPEIRPTA